MEDDRAEHDQRDQVEDAFPGGDVLVEYQQRERHRGDALGSEPAHEQTRGAVGASTEQGDEYRHWTREQKYDSDEHERRQPLARERVQGEQRAEHQKDAELVDIDDLIGTTLEMEAQIGPANPEHDRGDEHRDEAVAFG